MRTTTTLLVTTFLALWGPVPRGFAGPISGKIDLGSPTIISNTVSYAVTLDFSGGPDDRLTYFALDVSGSSPALTASNYAAFSFTLSGALNQWGEISPFGGVGNPGRAEFDDSLLQPLSSGVYTLGTLSVNLGTLGLTPNPSLTVSLMAAGTQIGAEDINDPGSFDLYAVTFGTGSRPAGVASGGGGGPAAVPEPSSWLLFAVGGAFLARTMRRKRQGSSTVA